MAPLYTENKTITMYINIIYFSAECKYKYFLDYICRLSLIKAVQIKICVVQNMAPNDNLTAILYGIEDLRLENQEIPAISDEGIKYTGKY